MKKLKLFYDDNKEVSFLNHNVIFQKDGIIVDSVPPVVLDVYQDVIYFVRPLTKDEEEGMDEYSALELRDENDKLLTLAIDWYFPAPAFMEVIDNFHKVTGA